MSIKRLYFEIWSLHNGKKFWKLIWFSKKLSSDFMANIRIKNSQSWLRKWKQFYLPYPLIHWKLKLLSLWVGPRLSHLQFRTAGPALYVVMSECDRWTDAQREVALRDQVHKEKALTGVRKKVVLLDKMKYLALVVSIARVVFKKNSRI